MLMVLAWKKHFRPGSRGSIAASYFSHSSSKSGARYTTLSLWPLEPMTFIEPFFRLTSLRFRLQTSELRSPQQKITLNIAGKSICLYRGNATGSKLSHTRKNSSNCSSVKMCGVGGSLSVLCINMPVSPLILNGSPNGA